MPGAGLDILQGQIQTVQTSRWIGRVVEVGRGVISVTGLSQVAALGDMVELSGSDGDSELGEIVQMDENRVIVLPDGRADGLQIGAPIKLLGQNHIAPHEGWIGHVIDPYGNALDGSPLLRGSNPRPLFGTPINPTDRRSLGGRLETGLAAFNTLLPIVRGQRIGLFAGSGVGKTMLMGKLAVGLQADLVVVAMVGERGREVRDFVERILGPHGMKRAIIVAATSDQSALTRRRCAWAAMSVAEHFRDQGMQVLFIADSITRFAEAHREVALAAGEQPSMRGFPPSTSHMITALCERAGPGAGLSSDITAVFSVLVAGSDMEEPIADILRGVLDGHVVLDREIAERGRYPAIDLLRSVSRALPHCASESENQLIADARKLLGTYQRNEIMIQAGLYSKGSDPDIDAALEAWPKLETFLAQSEFSNTQASFNRLAECILPTQEEEVEHSPLQHDESLPD